MRLYGEIIERTGAQTMLYLTCTTITSVDLAHYGVSRAKNWVSVDCGTRDFKLFNYQKADDKIFVCKFKKKWSKQYHIENSKTRGQTV